MRYAILSKTDQYLVRNISNGKAKTLNGNDINVIPLCVD